MKVRPLITGLGVVMVVGWVTVSVINVYRNRTWMGGERFTILNFESGLIELMSLDARLKSGIKLTIPGDVEIDTVGGRGRWRAEVMQIMGDKYGHKWAADSVSDTLGVGYTAYFWNGRFERGSRWDEGQWRVLSKGTEWKELDLGQGGWLRNKESADGVKTRELNENWFAQLKDRFSAVKIIEEAMEISVVNATEVTGLGAHATRWLESGGGKVEMINGEADKTDSCRVETDAETRESITAGWVQRMFACKFSQNDTLEKREIKLVLGEDYRRWWLGGD